MSFRYSRLIYLADTDMAGVVYFNQFLQFCHEAYEAWLMAQRLSLPNLLSQHQTALPIVHAEIDFMAPVHYGDHLTIELTPHQASDRRLVCDYRLYLAGDASAAIASPPLVATAQTHHVSVKLPERQVCPLPPSIQSVLTQAKASSGEV